MADMVTPKILSKTEITAELKNLPGWIHKNDKIRKEFSLKDFINAINFIDLLAPLFEKKGHHPDIHIFYNKIIFELQRYDSGGKVTDWDIETAHTIEENYKNRTG